MSETLNALETLSAEKVCNLLLEEFQVKVKDVSDTLNAITAPKLYKSCRTKNYLILAIRNAKNNVAFSQKTQNEKENVLVIYKKQFLCFNYETEITEAIKEIHKIIESQQ